MIEETIPDPAGLFDPQMATALRRRYSGLELVEIPNFAERYAHLCDLVCQLLWADRYGISPDTPMMSTSDPARAIASMICHAAGLVEEGRPT